MNKFTKILLFPLLFVLTLTCTEDRVINNGESMGSVRAKINQNFNDLYDSILDHTNKRQILELAFSIDTITKHRTDINSALNSIIAHDLRLDAMELIDHTHSNATILNNTTASYTTTIANLIATHTNNLLALLDSIADHTDTLQSHNARLTTLETTGVSGVLTASIQYICTTDTTSTSPNSTGYFIGVYDNIDGMNLVKVEALYAGSQGDMVLAADVWRNRSGVEAKMTTTGASFTSDATINSDYDDIATGDRLEIRWTYTGGTTAADGFMINLTFQEP